MLGMHKALGPTPGITKVGYGGRVTLVIPVLRRCMQEAQRFKTILSYLELTLSPTTTTTTGLERKEEGGDMGAESLCLDGVWPFSSRSAKLRRALWRRQRLEDLHKNLFLST